MAAKYRIDYAYGNVYQYSEEHNAYLFYAKISMLTTKEMKFIKANEA